MKHVRWLAVLAPLLLGSCLLPVPRRMVTRPALDVVIVDNAGLPVATAELLLVRYSFPHGRVDASERAHVDSAGRGHFDRRKAWQWILPLMPHGIPEDHFALAAWAAGRSWQACPVDSARLRIQLGRGDDRAASGPAAADTVWRARSGRDRAACNAQ